MHVYKLCQHSEHTDNRWLPRVDVASYMGPSQKRHKSSRGGCGPADVADATVGEAGTVNDKGAPVAMTSRSATEENLEGVASAETDGSRESGRGAAARCVRHNTGRHVIT
jgi:hypothetical protein